MNIGFLKRPVLLRHNLQYWVHVGNRFYFKKISGKYYLFSSIKAENPVYNVIRISAPRMETKFEKLKYFNQI